MGQDLVQVSVLGMPFYILTVRMYNAICNGDILRLGQDHTKSTTYEPFHKKTNIMVSVYGTGST